MEFFLLRTVLGLLRAISEIAMTVLNSAADFTLLTRNDHAPRRYCINPTWNRFTLFCVYIIGFASYEIIKLSREGVNAYF